MHGEHRRHRHRHLRSSRPAEPSSSYTLTASFPGDTTTSTPIGSNSSTSTFTVNPDTSSLTYTGPTTAVNGSADHASGTLTTDTPTTGTPLPTKVVTFTIGSGDDGTVLQRDHRRQRERQLHRSRRWTSRRRPRPSRRASPGDTYDTPGNGRHTPITVTEPTTLTVNPATSDYSDSTTVSGVLTGHQHQHADRR